MILTFYFICALLFCAINPRYGVLSIFLFAILLSNAQQLQFVESVRSFSTPFSILSLTSFNVIDKQGVRILIYVLLLSVLVRKLLKKEELREMWLLRLIVFMSIFQLISIVLNLSTISSFSKSISAMSFLSMSVVFLFAVLNVDYSAKDIKVLLTGLLLFVATNAAFQVYQYFYFANGDNDMTLGLLMSTTPTSILAFIVALFYLNGINSRMVTLELVLVLIISLVQILSAYVKGILAFAAVIIIGLRKNIFHKNGIILIISIFVCLTIFNIYVSDSDASVISR
jgi:hypothetical protein